MITCSVYYFQNFELPCGEKRFSNMKCLQSIDSFDMVSWKSCLSIEMFFWHATATDGLFATVFAAFWLYTCVLLHCNYFIADLKWPKLICSRFYSVPVARMSLYGLALCKLGLLLWLKNRCKSGCFWRLNRVGILEFFYVSARIHLCCIKIHHEACPI